MTSISTEQLESLLLHLSSCFDDEASSVCAVETESPKKLESAKKVSSLDISKSLYQGDHAKTVGLLKSLQVKYMVNLEWEKKQSWINTPEGAKYAKEGTPEYRVWKFVKNFSKTFPEEICNDSTISRELGDIRSVGVGKALAFKWISIDKGSMIYSSIADNVCDTFAHCLEEVELHGHDIENLYEALRSHSDREPEHLLRNELKKRKLVTMEEIKYCLLTKGEKFQLKIPKSITDLTAEMLSSGSWKFAEMKPYNFFGSGKRPSHGTIHPLIQMLKKFKYILTTMGFEEMPTNRWLESSFWNFDALFMPQLHPARDIQDTFFVQNPEFTAESRLPAACVTKVSQMHQFGGEGSLGWGYEWSVKEAQKNILRTHTTAVSARMLRKLAEDYEKTGIFTPKKYFSIDRVFRNETLDATHLAEFHQVEGLIADKGMSMANLMGFMTVFYEKIGLSELRFKPAYNPYTEPSLEIFGFHPQLKKWIEVGNSGVFRPELLIPLGVPPEIQVIAWGLSLERPSMIKFKKSNIRELFGPKAALKMTAY